MVGLMGSFPAGTSSEGPPCGSVSLTGEVGGNRAHLGARCCGLDQARGQ